jgi:hypothetical protein
METTGIETTEKIKIKHHADGLATRAGDEWNIACDMEILVSG